MSLKDRVTEDMKSAMRSGDKRRLGVIRLLLAAVKQREVDERIPALDDDQVVATLDKMVKQRRESISQYEKAGRTDLADQEHYEVSVLQEYLPAALSEAEIDALIDAAVTDTGASSIKDMGKVMGILKPQMQGRADMGAVSARIKARLGA
jgi:uncharacterized protein